jgi:hypothetical protein
MVLTSVIHRYRNTLASYEHVGEKGRHMVQVEHHLMCSPRYVTYVDNQKFFCFGHRYF